MGDQSRVYYGECCKVHKDLGNKADGCQAFEGDLATGKFCSICGCHRNFHREILQHTTEVAYTECHKTRQFGGVLSVDGCKEYTSPHPSSNCEACGCHKSYHRNEVKK